MKRTAPLGLSLALLAACSANGGGSTFIDSDSGARADRSVTPIDRGVADDTGAPTPDSPVPPPPPPPPMDGATGADATAADVTSVYDTGTTAADGCTPMGCPGRPSGCGAREVCGNGLDDNCNGTVDESCPCIPGTVQDCFLGPPGSRSTGACHDGSQRCTGSGEFGTWSPCTGGISPSAETCDALDNDCDGCADDGLCCGSELRCPSADDSRVPSGQPFVEYPLRGELFFSGTARSWQWEVRGGPCDALLRTPTFTTRDLNARDAAFHPTLSGDYSVTLTVVTMAGETLRCTFVVHIAGPGLRVELCWDTNTTVDLDLYLHTPRNTDPWFNNASTPLISVNQNSCNWSNCEAVLRGGLGRVEWGYARSPLSACENGPHGPEWRTVGNCGNPRLDIDNNLSKASGVPENINVDTPREGERFRVMVENFTGTSAHPMVNVYCGGHLRATIGAAPDVLPDFTGSSGSSSIGAMWRAADIVVHTDSTGATTGCDVTPLHPAGATSGFNVTRNDPSY